MIPVLPENISEEWAAQQRRTISGWEDVDCGWYLDYVGNTLVKGKPPSNDICKYKSGSTRMKNKFEEYSRIMSAAGFTKEDFMVDGKPFCEERDDRELTIMEMLLIARPEALIQLKNKRSRLTQTQKDHLEELEKSLYSYYEHKSGFMCKDSEGRIFKESSEGAGEVVSLRHLIREKMNIEVCPYCGSSSLTPRTRYVTAETDHILPKKAGDNKLFSICLFNLIPCCPTCNRIKSDKELCISPYDDKRTHQNPYFRFELKAIDPRAAKENIKLYLVADEPSGEHTPSYLKVPSSLYGYGDDAYLLQLTQSSKQNEDLFAPIEMKFGLEETIRFIEFAQNYSSSYTNMLIDIFPQLGEEYFRPYSGYSSLDYLHIPFSKLYHDLYEQYGMGYGENFCEFQQKSAEK